MGCQLAPGLVSGTILAQETSEAFVKHVTLVNSGFWWVHRGGFTLLGQRVGSEWIRHLPFGTLGVNFIGSLLLALIMYACEYRGLFGEEARVFLTIGVLGSFTTMSTFSYESIKLLEQDQHILFGLNLVGTITLCLLAVYLGKFLITVTGLR